MKFSLSFGKRLAFFACVSVFCLVLVGLVAGFITYKFGADSTRALRIATVLQDILLFILPALVTAVVITRLPATFLCLDRGVDPRFLMLAVITLGVSIPLMNCVIQWNESLQLPPSFDELAAQLRAAEESARHGVEVILGDSSVMSLIVSVLIVGVLTGFSEEIFFRGAFQRLLTTSGRVNPHLAVWLVAFLFSAFHFQFYGFVPRLLLGAFFGYLMLWSGSVWVSAILHALNNSIFVVDDWLTRCKAAAAGVDVSEVASSSSQAVDSFFGFSPWFSIALSIVLTAYFLFRLWQARLRPAVAARPGSDKA